MMNMAKPVKKKTVKAGLFYDGSGKPPLKDVYLTFDQKVLSVSSKKPVNTEYLGEFPVVTPAFIDAHAHIGLERAGEPYTDDEVNEHLDSVLTLADALDSVQMDDKAFKISIEAGVLYSCVLPGSGNIIGGRSAVIRNYGRNTSEALIKRAGIKSALGYNPMSTTDWKGTRPSTRMGVFSILRKHFLEVKNKLKDRKKRKELTPEERVIADILSGKEFLRVHVHKSDDITALIRFADEFGIKFTVEHACNVADIETFNMLKKRGVRVVYGPLDSFPYKVELKNEDWRNIKYLLESGVEFGLMSDHPVILQSNLMLTLRWFIRMGLRKEEALSIITKRNAKILGIDRILGTLDRGKWASFVAWNGDPFSLTSYPVLVFGEGRLLYNE